jgi:hypothetical protein
LAGAILAALLIRLLLLSHCDFTAIRHCDHCRW